MPDDSTTDTTATSDSTAATSTTDTSTEEDGLGDAGKAAIKRERDARKAAEKQLSELQSQLKTFEDRDKTELQKAQEAAEKAQRDHSDLSARYRSVLAEQAVRDAAADAGARNVKAVYRYIKDDLEISDEGKVTNLDTVLKAAKRDAPELFGTGGGKADGGRGGGTQNGATDMNSFIRDRARR